jgi:hypothetical protein
MSRNTVQRYLKALDRGGLLQGEPGELPDIATLGSCVDARRSELP